MLVEFQQALADLTASPELCVRVRQEPSLLKERYELTDREWHRLVGIVRHPGMACACMVYRANRLAPLALNIPETCRALGKQLRAVVSEYWRLYPEGNVHFFLWRPIVSAVSSRQSWRRTGASPPKSRRCPLATRH